MAFASTAFFLIACFGVPLGALTGFADVAYANGEDASGNAYAVVVRIDEYESGSAQYAISLYGDGSLAGFYVK